MTARYILPVLRYRPEVATLIGRYLLNAASNTRLFYSDCISAEKQSRPELTSAIPYERLTRTLNGKSPYASGGYGSHRSIYGGAYALWWGELLKATRDPQILQMNVGLTDFYEQEKYPTYLFYNPFPEPRSVILTSMARATQLYDLTSHAFLAPRGSRATLELPASGARVVVLIPRDARRKLNNGTLYCDEVAVDYAPRTLDRPRAAID